MATKTRFIGVRLTQEQQRKLILLSVSAGDPGNMSAGLRWMLDLTRVNGSIDATTPDIPFTDHRPAREARHAEK